MKFIIAYGRFCDLEIIEAKDHDDALAAAVERSMADGVLDDDLADTTWAEPWSPEKAKEYGFNLEAVE